MAARITASLPVCLAAGLLAAVFAGVAVAPAASPFPGDDKKPKREKFGSSLKRLRWDPVRQAAVETAGQTRSGDASQSEDAIKLETLLVVFDVLVVTRGTQKIITGLSKDDFIITEDERRQQVATFALGDDAARPRSIILIIDGSASQEPYVETSTEAAKTLVSQLGPKDEMGIVTDDVELLVDFTRDKTKLTGTLDKLKKRVLDERKFSKSAQFTALFAALRELTDNKETRPVIIFQTDGDEAVSFPDQPDASSFAFLRRKMPSYQYGLSDIFAAAERSRATIYTVITNERLIGIPVAEAYERLLSKRGVIRSGSGVDPFTESQTKLYLRIFRQGQLASVHAATLTGGWTAWLDKPDQASQIYSQILSDMNNRYIIGYYPANTDRDGKLRKVRIEVKGHPEYQVHGRASYYAPDS